MAADTRDILFESEGLTIGLAMSELDERSGSIKFAISVNWTHPLRQSRASWSGTAWVAYEALDAFDAELRTAETAVLRDLSAHPVLAVSAGSDPDVLIRETTAGYPHPYGEGPTLVTATVSAGAIKAWGEIIRAFPRWW